MWPLPGPTSRHLDSPTPSPKVHPLPKNYLACKYSCRWVSLYRHASMHICTCVLKARDDHLRGPASHSVDSLLLSRQHGCGHYCSSPLCPLSRLRSLGMASRAELPPPPPPHSICSPLHHSHRHRGSCSNFRFEHSTSQVPL